MVVRAFGRVRIWFLMFAQASVRAKPRYISMCTNLSKCGMRIGLGRDMEIDGVASEQIIMPTATIRAGM